MLSITPRQSISTYYHPPAELSNVMPRKISKGSHLSCMGHSTKIMPREVVYYILSGILRKRGYLDHSHRGSGSTPSDSYFWLLRVLPVLLYHICGITTPGVCFLTVWEWYHKYSTTFEEVLPEATNNYYWEYSQNLEENP